MLRTARSHISSNVVAYLALFVALGGTSYGVATGFIDSREIKNNTIRTGDLRNNEVRSRDIRNRTLVGRDHLNNSLGGDQVNESKLGQVPNAAAADIAANANALGGLAASAFARAPAANSADYPGGPDELLEIPGMGTLRMVECAPNFNLAEVGFRNESTGVQDQYRALPAPAAYDATEPGDFGVPVVLGGTGYNVLRVAQQADRDRQATITVFSTELTNPDRCRISAQAVLSG